jgi:hypothetical protein
MPNTAFSVGVGPCACHTLDEGLQMPRRWRVWWGVRWRQGGSGWM